MKRAILLLSLIALFVQCKDDEIDPKESFTKIYDSFRSDHDYNPIDVVALDTGYLILAGQKLSNSQYMGVQLIKLDEAGNYTMEDEVLPEAYVAPIGDLVTIGDNHYFLTMEEQASYGARLVEVMGNSPADYNIITPGGGLTFPLAMAKTENDELLILSYNAGSEQMVISLHATDGSRIGGNGYAIGAGATFDDITGSSIFDHYIDPERDGLPFFCGQIPGGDYYFNGVYGYTMSWVFTNFGNTPTGQVQGQGAHGGMTAALPLGGNSFSIFGYQYNDNFINPIQTVDYTSSPSSVDYFSLPFSEFKSRTNAKIISADLGLSTYSIVAAESQSRQVVLYFYDSTSGELAGIHKIGHLNPYELSSIKLDADNNLMVLGTTLVSGRLPRIFFSKIPEKELLGFVGQ
ncbi:hypothetical protein [Reichenbachiella ulvae]|uniref:DUF4394 domain-containing protein n=1 Tax=Reichenbachiella ulvae TaxID=2980104 RepID=A0ABT3CSX9_9BACT|nr:hypothetical protein [Reichenbachiella ulvae]MCV9386810.1 hypothetical protein [Reichenbachiella ulvae]